MTLIATLSTPVWAQEKGDARLGGGSDIPPEVTVLIPQGGSIPPVHTIFADNPTDDPVEVEFRAEAHTGIIIDPEWEERTIPGQGGVENPFSVEVAGGLAPGEYPVMVQLVRSDIESEPGQITNIPAIQATFTVEVTGEAAAVTVRSVSAHSGEPVEATITLSARHGDRGWFEIDRTEGATLESLVSPGEFRTAVLLGEREVAAEEFTVEADETLDVVLEVETVSFIVAAARPVTEQGRLVVVDLLASVNNETDPIPGPNRLQARVFRGEEEVDTITLDELSRLPDGITESTVTYRPEGGWQAGSYRFVFELVTPGFTLTAADQPVLEAPEMGFDLLALLAALETHEAIALAAAGILALILVERLVRYLIRRRRPGARPTRKQRRQERAETRRARRSGRKKKKKSPKSPQPEASWLEERIGPTTAPTSPWDGEGPDSSAQSSPMSSSADPTAPPRPSGSHLAPTGQRAPDAGSPDAIPPDNTPPVPPADSSGMTHMVEALRVVQRLHDEESLAEGWSITDATLIYWAMISPQVHEALGSVGMSDEEYLAAMRRLFTRGLLERGGLPTGDTIDQGSGT